MVQLIPETQWGRAEISAERKPSVAEKLKNLKMEQLAPVMSIAFVALMSYLNIKNSEAQENPESVRSELAGLKDDISTPVGQDVLPAEKGEVSFDQERFNKLAEEKGDKTALLSHEIYNRYATALELGKKYQSEVRVENFDGTARTIKNSCVGFVMSVLAGLPLKISDNAKSNMGRYLSEYHWGGNDGLENFIPDIAGGDTTKYHRIEELDPDNIDGQVGSNLATGEYAIAAFYNHVLLIYKDINGKIKMVHSGADVDESGKGRSHTSQVNETTLQGYAERMKKQGKPMQFAFMPISNIVELAENSGNRELDSFVSSKIA